MAQSTSTARAEAVAERLRATEQPALEEFFPDRRMTLRRPPLVREPMTRRSWREQTMFDRAADQAG